MFCPATLLMMSLGWIGSIFFIFEESSVFVIFSNFYKFQSFVIFLYKTSINVEKRHFEELL